MDYIQELQEKGEKSKVAARKLAIADTNSKNLALLTIADSLESNAEVVFAANEKDISAAKAKGLSKALLDRLLLTGDRIHNMAQGLRQIAALPDPVGSGNLIERRPNGLEITKIRVPLGVIGIIYEARPNVTVDAAGLCLKAGNAVILRGGSEAITSNLAMVALIREALVKSGLSEDSVQLIGTTDRQAVQALLKLHQYIDVVIPRGGAGLIKMVVENSTIPVIETGTGVCHTFVDASADLTMAAAVAFNAKVSRPAVCNAMETLLVHTAIAEQFLPGMLQKYCEAGVELRGCPKARNFHPAVKPATDADWSTEYSDLILSVKVVADLDEALMHIATYGTRHSEAIITSNYQNAKRFQQEVDAAAVYVNASTRFTDGFEFGLGAEIGISTQKLHARGPMGLNELTSTKFVISGNGQIR